MKINDLVNENDMVNFFKDLQKNNPKFKNLRVHGDPEHDELRRKDAEERGRRLSMPAPTPKELSHEERHKLEQELGHLEAQFDPYYQYSDDHSVYTKHHSLAQRINSIKHRLKQNVAEDHDQGERMDEMAMGELKNIANNVKKIYNMLQQGRQLDTWEYSYITTANDHLTTVAEVVATSELEESASAGATSSANVGTVVSPQIAIGKKNIGNKGYTGSPGKSGTKAPKPPKIVQRKNKDGTAKNGLDEPNLFGGGSIKRR
jgi:hypothetical protein